MTQVFEDEEIWEEVKKDFPDDEMMQEIHFIRLKHFYRMKNLSIDEIVKFYQTK